MLAVRANFAAQAFKVWNDGFAIDFGNHVNDFAQVCKQAAFLRVFVNATGWVLTVRSEGYTYTANSVAHCFFVFIKSNSTHNRLLNRLKRFSTIPWHVAVQNCRGGYNKPRRRMPTRYASPAAAPPTMHVSAPAQYQRWKTKRPLMAPTKKNASAVRIELTR